MLINYESIPKQIGIEDFRIGSGTLLFSYRKKIAVISDITRVIHVMSLYAKTETGFSLVLNAYSEHYLIEFYRNFYAHIEAKYPIIKGYANSIAYEKVRESSYNRGRIVYLDKEAGLTLANERLIDQPKHIGLAIKNKYF